MQYRCFVIVVSKKWNILFDEYQTTNLSVLQCFVFSDQCAAMGTALFSTMPDTIHLWCKWHVLLKAPDSLGPVYSKNSKFRHQQEETFCS
jgi:hypothetical protein